MTFIHRDDLIIGTLYFLYNPNSSLHENRFVNYLTIDQAGAYYQPQISWYELDEDEKMMYIADQL